MALKMKMHFVDVVQQGTLRNVQVDGEKVGFQFDIRLGYYRGHFLSCIDEFWVTVDGEKYEGKDLWFCLGDKEFGADMLKLCSTEFWPLLKPATVKVYKKGGLAKGNHQVNVQLMLRVPYMAMPGSTKPHDYVPLDSCGSGELYCEG